MVCDEINDSDGFRLRGVVHATIGNIAEAISDLEEADKLS